MDFIYTKNSGRRGLSFRYTKNVVRRRLDFIYTKNAARRRLNYIYTKNLVRKMMGKEWLFEKIFRAARADLLNIYVKKFSRCAGLKVKKSYKKEAFIRVGAI